MLLYDIDNCVWGVQIVRLDEQPSNQAFGEPTRFIQRGGRHIYGPIARSTSASARSQALLSPARSAARARASAAVAVSARAPSLSRASAASIELGVGWRWVRAAVLSRPAGPSAAVAAIIASTRACMRSISGKQGHAWLGMVERV